MTDTEERTLQVVAESPEDAIAQAARTSGLSAAELRVATAEPLKTLPWQKKRFRYTIRHTPPAPAAPVGRDGAWSVRFQDGSVMLSVSPPSGDGKRVRLEDLLTESRNWPLESVERATLSAIVERASGQPEAAGYYGTAGESPYRVVVAPSDMAAYLICGNQRPEGEQAAQEILEALTAAGVTHGVDQEAIQRLLAEWRPGAAVLVAKGALPVPGRDASLYQNFTAGGYQPVYREDGSVDYFASQLTPAVTVGSVLAGKEPATPGTEGYTVRGAALPAQPGKDLDLKRMVGKGVALSEDGLQVLATIEGTPSLAGGKYSVLPSLRVDQDVGFGTGNIDFPGSVIIAGDVQDNFVVRADGDMTVRGTVQAAELEATGQITLMAGIHGRDKGRIKAKGDVRAAFLDACTVEAGGDVLVSGEIINSVITAGGAVNASGQGRIVGGVITAGTQVVANTLGSPIGRVTTRVVVTGRPPAAAEGDETPRPPVRPAVKVRGITYPPTHITIMGARRTIDSEIEYAAFTVSEGEVILSPYA